MSAQPGWYDAGVPGQQRWWDGVQWTPHVQASQNPPMPVQSAPMGWFPVPGTSDVRWWDGTGWTPYRLRDGKPRPDAFAIEPAGTGIALGAAFLVLGVTQLSTYNFTGQAFFAVTPALFFLSGVLWLIGGMYVTRLKKLPTPSTTAVLDPRTLPLAGEVEGPSAGWYPVAGTVRRWWTGVRWSEYIGQKIGVRPTHSGARGYRIGMGVGWGITGLGALGTVLGFALIFALDGWIAAAIIVPSVVFALAGGAVLLSVHLRRYTLIIPPQPPVLS